jgi:hypothetical protein
MAQVSLGLGYLLPLTRFSVVVDTRTVLNTNTPGVTMLASESDVRVAPEVVGDSTARQSLTLDAGLLEKISLTISLDDRGVIQSINTESGRDISPVLNLAGRVISLALPTAEIAAAGLEDQWDGTHPALADLRTRLSQQSSTLLARMVEGGANEETIARAGAALEKVQFQLASISALRRHWIESQVGITATNRATLTVADLPSHSEPEPPRTLPTGLSLTPASQALADAAGVLVLLLDPDREAVEPSLPDPRQDFLTLRRTRAAAIAVYLLSTNELGVSEWALVPESVAQLDIVDRHSPLDSLSLDGAWLRSKKFELAFHPDMSLKTFGFSTTPAASAIATATGDALEAIGAAREKASGQASEDEQRLKRLKTKVDLLKTADEFELLSADRKG